MEKLNHTCVSVNNKSLGSSDNEIVMFAWEYTFFVVVDDVLLTLHDDDLVPVYSLSPAD